MLLPYLVVIAKGLEHFKHRRHEFKSQSLHLKPETELLWGKGAFSCIKGLKTVPLAQALLSLKPAQNKNFQLTILGHHRATFAGLWHPGRTLSSAISGSSTRPGSKEELNFSNHFDPYFVFCCRVPDLENVPDRESELCQKCGKYQTKLRRHHRTCLSKSAYLAHYGEMVWKIH